MKCDFAHSPNVTNFWLKTQYKSRVERCIFQNSLPNHRLPAGFLDFPHIWDIWAVSENRLHSWVKRVPEVVSSIRRNPSTKWVRVSYFMVSTGGRCLVLGFLRTDETTPGTWTVKPGIHAKCRMILWNLPVFAFILRQAMPDFEVKLSNSVKLTSKPRHCLAKNTGRFQRFILHLAW